MFGLGWQEVILILTILLFVFGPEKLPEIARELGRAVQEFSRASSGLARAVGSSSTKASRSNVRTTEKWKRDKMLSDVAERLNITTEGKTNEEIAREIIAEIESREKASNTKVKR